MTIDLLREGESGHILSSDTEGEMRRRLQDLGLLPGTKITCLTRGRGIAAYLVRGAVIALREETAAQLTIDN